MFVIVMENESAASVLHDTSFKRLASEGTLLTRYFGVAHPSEPNYLAMVAGAPIVSDDGRHNLPQTNLVDLLEAAGISWKAYQEDYPGNCFAGSSAGLYARKHNPFISFNDIRTNPARCARIVNANQLAADLAANALPAFSFYTPNLEHDGHDAPLADAGAWLAQFLDARLRDPNFARGTLVIVTFDEGSGSPASTPLYTLLLGDGVRAGATDGAVYNHYSLLRTVEEIFGLGSLHRGDLSAMPFASCDYEGGCG